MNSHKLKNTCLILLVVSICLSFCGYVLLPPVNAVSLVKVMNDSDDNSESAEESTKELKSSFLYESPLRLHPLYCIAVKLVVPTDIELPFYYPSLHTPPPDHQKV